MTWLQRRAQEIKKSWERILLEELFVFSGGLEGAWVTTSPGWIPGKELHHNDDRAGVTFGRGRVSSSSFFFQTTWWEVCRYSLRLSLDALSAMCWARYRDEHICKPEHTHTFHAPYIDHPNASR